MASDAQFFAHSLEDRPTQQWQSLRDHLLNVAELAHDFAEPFGAERWAYLAGLWHDLGKYSRDFQAHLGSEEEASAETLSGRVDHSSAGAQYAVHGMPILGHIIAYAIAGHHSGLLDGRSIGSCQNSRLSKAVPPWKHGLTELPSLSMPPPPSFLREALGRRPKDSFAVAMFVRMVFSCVVDADFLDTEAFMHPSAALARDAFVPLVELADRFFPSLRRMVATARDTPVNRQRNEVQSACELAATKQPGFFSLTVPTGGGKTLSSLAFALRHAAEHDLRRVVYVAPFTSIIEQNAEVFRSHLGTDALIEHHSSVQPDKETRASRLASENWDAPVIVTTAVQFYESLFANRASQCRKLHRLARSVVILDEAQTIPVDCLKPSLRTLDELVRNYGCTVVLCTATQPEIRHRPEFEIGLQGVREIMPDPPRLYRALRRVELRNIGRQTDRELIARLLDEPRVLCIVNTTREARVLFESLGPDHAHFHLSARMCPAHRRIRLRQIRRALDTNATCRVISTQVVEAGVDIDFPVVYRSLAGLDSIAQAAGRCNRNGLLPERGRTFVFDSEHTRANRYFADTAQCAAEVMEIHAEDPLALDAIEHFFKLYYWDQKSRWDARHVLECFRLTNDRTFPLDFNFATAARSFRMIDDAGQCGVIVPWGRRGRQLCEQLRRMAKPTRESLRKAQRYIVQVRRRDWDAHVGTDIQLLFDNLGTLESAETHYSDDTGLNLEAEGPGIYMA